VRGRWIALLLFTLVALLLAGPVLVLRHVVTEGRACFARIEAPRDGTLPDCSGHEGWLAPLAPLPWVGLPARRLQEELTVRMVVARYHDAAVGRPSRQAREARFAALGPARQQVEAGTKRLRLDELGPVLPVLEPGVLAAQAGDRASLIEHGDGWKRHYVQGHAIRAALLETQVKRAVELAKRYWDTDNDDLLIQLSALTCIEGQWERGMNRAAAIEKDRAERRTANFSINFGAPRVVVEACAAGALRPPPPPPSYGHAGDWDQRARLLVMRMRQLRAPDGCDWSSDAAECWQRAPVVAHVEQLRLLLLAEEQSSYRLEILATIAESLGTPAEVQSLMRPRPTVPSLVAELPLLAADWVERRPDQPFVTAERFQAAARHLESLVAPKGESEAAQAAALRQVAAALRVKAAIGHALRGDPHPSDLEGVDLAQLGPGPWAQLLGANVALLSGDRDEARRHLDGLGSTASPVGAAAWLTRAELSLSDREAAVSHGQQALQEASAAKDSPRVAQALWLLVSLGELDDAQRAPLRPRVTWLGRDDGRVPLEVRQRALFRQLTRWHGWLGQPADQRHATRYVLFRQRGDAPRALAAYLHAAGQLVDEPGAVEPWLDAVMAQDAGRLRLSSHAFARWRAARWRGDPEEAASWRQRFATLSRLAAQPATAELFQQLGL